MNQSKVEQRNKHQIIIDSDQFLIIEKKKIVNWNRK